MKKDQIPLIQELISNYFEVVSDCFAIIIMDEEGDISHTQKSEKDSYNIGEYGIFNIKKAVQFILERLEIFFPSPVNYATSTIESDNYRVLCIKAENFIYVFLLDIYAQLHHIYPYAYLAVEKMHRILSEEQTVQVSIPKLGNIEGDILDTPTNGDGDEWNFKFILVGSNNVGKTSIVNQYVNHKLEKDYRPTIGVNVMAYSHEFMGYKVKWNIFDIGAQKQFIRVRRNYYFGANSYFLVFDLSDRQSFEDIRSWKKELLDFIGDDHGEDVPFILVGNKSDLEHVVSFEEGSDLAKELNGKYIETSALKNHHIEDSFNLIFMELINKFKKK